jgi:uncharacterized membrane protein YedE/YeeE
MEYYNFFFIIMSYYNFKMNFHKVWVSLSCQYNIISMSLSFPLATKVQTSTTEVLHLVSIYFLADFNSKRKKASKQRCHGMESHKIDTVQAN